MKRFLTFLKYVVVAFFLGLCAFLLWVSYHYTVPIVMYHNIENVEGHRSDTVSLESFEKQIRFLTRYDYNVIGYDELIDGIKNKVKFPRNTVVITFDDGLENNYTNAFPVLKKYGQTATFFVPFGDINRKGFLTEEQLNEMISAGFIIGSHTMTHDYLPDLSVEDQEFQITKSKSALEDMFDIDVNFFAYPVGGFTEDSKRLVREAGYKSAVTTNRGYDPLNHDLFEVNRIKLSDRDSNDFLIFWKLTGYYTSLKTPRAPY